MYIGSLLEKASGVHISYSYKKRGMDKAYLPDLISEEKTNNKYESEGRLISDYVGFDGAALLYGGVDIEISLDRESFVDTLTFKQGENSQIAKIQVLSNGEPVGLYSPETGKAVCKEDISIGLGIYTNKLVLRLSCLCRHIIIGKLDLLGAVDLEKMLYPLPQSLEYKEGHLADTSAVTCEIIPADNEFYNISVTPDKAKITASSRSCLCYAKARLKALETKDGIPCVQISDSPFMQIRGIHMCLPDRDKIPFFKSLVEHLLVPMGYNTVFLQISGAMEYKKHPKINSAWLEAVKNYEAGIWPKPAHWECMSHDILTQEEVSDLCSHIKSFGMDVIPEVQTLGHTQYITMAYPKLGEIEEKTDETIDLYAEDVRIGSFYTHCMCPNHKDYYKITHEIIDEVIDVTGPEKYLHIGHDEIYTIGKCRRCKNIPEHMIYAKEVNALNEYIKSKGLTTMMWSDMIQETKYASSKAINLISKDIICLSFTWYFHLDDDVEDVLYDKGFKIILGNFYSSHYPRFAGRRLNPNILGAEVSTWVWCNELNLGFDGKLYDFMYSANMLWSPCYDERLRRTYGELIQRIYPSIAKKLGTGYMGDNAPELKIPKNSSSVPWDIRHKYEGALDVGYGEQKTLEAGVFARKISFLHSTDVSGERIVWETPKPQGVYTLVYEDGSKCEIDILYGANIFEYKRLYGRPFESDLYRHEGYVATCLAKPHMGKTADGEDFCLYEYTFENPNPAKKIQKILVAHTGETDAKIILYKIKYTN